MPNKYIKSNHNMQCLGPCYEAYKWVNHPLTFEPTSNKEAYCCVNPYNKKSKNLSRIDECIFTGVQKTDSSIFSQVPIIDISCEKFLKIYGEITSFDTSINYIENKKYIPIDTKIRIMNCALSVYGDKLEIIDYIVVDFFIEVIKKKWIYLIFNLINPYLYINDGKISIKKLEYYDENLKNEKYNFIIYKFINQDFIRNFLYKYIKYNKNKWNEIHNHIENIKIFLFDYIEKKIKISIKNI
jgi:hypothetical protein